MKHHFILIISFIFLYSVGAKSACPTPLSYDFPLVPYNGEFTQSIPLSTSPLCVLHYKYCWRATTAFYDFAITEVSLEGECDQFKDIDTLIKYASRDLIANRNPWGANQIPECPVYSNAFYRQSTAACFSDFYWDPLTLRWTSIPCDNDGLERWCWTIYQYCWEYINNEQYLRENIISFSMGGPPCPSFNPWGLGCNQRCQ